MDDRLILVAWAIVTAIIAAIAAWRYRGGFVPVHWSFIVAMSMGSIVIAIYYVSLLCSPLGDTGHFELLGIRGTRWIHGFILFVTAGLSVGALLMGRKKNG